MHRQNKENAFRCVILLFSMLTGGCSTQEAQKDGFKPELVMRVASLNLSNLSRRIEKKDVKKFAEVLKQEQVDVLAVQGVTRYPGVETRVDFVDELSRQAELRNAFGEMINNSGHQIGNAVFSAYPVRSQSNHAFDNVKSAKFEAALQAVIDGGTRDVYVVSTLLPPKASVEDLVACLAGISSMRDPQKHDAVILTGNFPLSDKLLSGGNYRDVQEADAKNIGTRIWYSNNKAVKPASVRIVDTDLGPFLVAQFGLFREVHP